MIIQNQDYEKIFSGTIQVIPRENLIEKLKSGKRLKVKLGMDPTTPNLHLGHTIVLSKLKQFQDLGHEVIFLIGDFTARIGDPTGRSKTRPSLTQNEIKKNMQTYFNQVGKILDTKKATILYNSSWLDPLTSTDIIKLLAKVTLARITERDDFHRRIKNHESICMHELLYPILQAYDSVILKADIELGGTDQTFNLLMGRFLQEQFSQQPQAIITTPLLEGLNGKKKMSKSFGNAIELAGSAYEAFGQLMSISDQLMWHYFSILLGKSPAEISQMETRVASGNLNPMELKKDMAHEIVLKFWSNKKAIEARKTFESLFQKKDYSKAHEFSLPKGTPKSLWIVDLLKLLKAVESSSQAKRLIDAKAVHINDIPITDFKANITWTPGAIVKVGKIRIYKLK